MVEKGRSPREPYKIGEPVPITKHHMNDDYPGDIMYTSYCSSTTGVVIKLIGRGLSLATARCTACTFTSTVRQKQQNDSGGPATV